MVISKRSLRQTSKVFCSKIGFDYDEETAVKLQEAFRANLSEYDVKVVKPAEELSNDLIPSLNFNKINK